MDRRQRGNFVQGAPGQPAAQQGVGFAEPER